MRKFLNWKVILLIVFLVFSLITIAPNPLADGIMVKNVESGSLIASMGISPGEKVTYVNDKPVKTAEEFNNALKYLEAENKTITVTTNLGALTYNASNSIGFKVDDNLTVVQVDEGYSILEGVVIKKINNEAIANVSEFNNITDSLFPKQKISITTSKNKYVYLTNKKPEITVGLVKTNNIKMGLDLEGGTRVLIQPKKENGTVTAGDVDDLITVMSNRLNVYGLSDLTIRAANDLEGNKFILIEIAGVGKEEVKELIGKQGKFEAKIGEDVVFIGGKNDIPFVCREDGTCSGVRGCDQVSSNQWTCSFEFAIKLSDESAKRHAEITNKLDVNTSTRGGSYLSKTLDLYLDKKKVDSLQIAADLKGKESKDIAISGPGFGSSRADALDSAVKSMNKLQTILITGSLPVDIQIVKLDSISPVLGKSFINNALLVLFLSIITVSLIIYIRYRSLKITIPIIITMLSEIFIIFGVAAFIQWNIDLAAIAGIIASVGTGVNDQIVITDEILSRTADRFLTWKEKIKRAFFIIFSAYATLLVAMFPLLFAGAGLIRGFALTTIIGFTIGVLVTRPAFASIAEYLIEKED